MKSVSLLLLFVGSLLLVSGLTQDRMRKEKKRLIYKYLPKNGYEDQWEDYPQMSSMFDEDANQFYR